MLKPKLLVDTNVIIDYLNGREPYFEKARLLMLAGRVGDFDLWISSSQASDLVYILSDGGRRSLMARTLERLRGLRTFINVYAVGSSEVDKMLASSWADPEDALLFEVALSLKADAIVSRNKSDFESHLIRVFDCEELFDWLEREHGVAYEELVLA